jgi:hypothetical protein
LVERIGAQQLIAGMPPSRYSEIAPAVPARTLAWKKWKILLYLQNILQSEDARRTCCGF